MRIMLGVLFIIAAAVLTTLNARGALDNSILFTAAFYPEDSGCRNPTLDTENSGLFPEGRGYRVKIFFTCDLET